LNGGSFASKEPSRERISTTAAIEAHAQHTIRPLAKRYQKPGHPGNPLFDHDTVRRLIKNHPTQFNSIQFSFREKQKGRRLRVTTDTDEKEKPQPGLTQDHASTSPV